MQSPARKLEYQRLYYQKNKVRLNESNKRYAKEHRDDILEHRRNNRHKCLLRAARSRAKRFALPFNITLEDVTIPKLCPILLIPIISGVDQATDNSPSLDRIIPELGYVKGNVQVISRRANQIKNCASFEELIIIGKWAESAYARHRDILTNMNINQNFADMGD